MITDSGGIQEETTFLNVPCLTLRDNTERPITITLGTNVLVGNDNRNLRSEMAKILEGKGKRHGPSSRDGRCRANCRCIAMPKGHGANLQYIRDLPRKEI